jgi:endogenous inhibitor of DNA gyrase (YacG/DUF329 family)
MIVKCTECGKEVKKSPSRLKDRRPFCSRQCYEKDWARRVAGWNKGHWFKGTCPVCGKEFVNGVGGLVKERCSARCANVANAKPGEKNPAWKGGRFVTNGRVYVFAPGHPRNHHGHVFEHIIVAERALGHYLPEKAQVHHIDKNPVNNRPDNLVICQSDGYHKLLHARMRRLLKAA